MSTKYHLYDTAKQQFYWAEVAAPAAPDLTTVLTAGGDGGGQSFNNVDTAAVNQTVFIGGDGTNAGSLALNNDDATHGLTVNATDTGAELAPGAVGDVLDVNSVPLVNLVDPSAAQDAATKNYVDTAVAGAGGGGPTIADVTTGVMVAGANPLATIAIPAGKTKLRVQARVCVIDAGSMDTVWLTAGSWGAGASVTGEFYAVNGNTSAFEGITPVAQAGGVGANPLGLNGPIIYVLCCNLVVTGASGNVVLEIFNVGATATVAQGELVVDFSS